jgi:hypothetical protein
MASRIEPDTGEPRPQGGHGASDRSPRHRDHVAAPRAQASAGALAAEPEFGRPWRNFLLQFNVSLPILYLCFS